MQLCYWFTCFVLLAAYASDLTARLKLPSTYTSISDYSDIDGKKVGVYSQYKSIAESLGADTKTYGSGFTEAKDMIDDVKDGDIDAGLLPLYHAMRLTANNCDVKIVGDVFIPNYYVIALSNSLSDTTRQQITASNAKMHQFQVTRSLLNKALLVSDEEVCNQLLERPVTIEYTAGLWILIGCGIILSLPVYILHRRMMKQQVEVVVQDQGKIEFDYKKSGELDLIDKFEKILASSEYKFVQKMKDLEVALEKYT